MPRKRLIVPSPSSGESKVFVSDPGKTFSIQRLDRKAGVWLCVTDNGADTPIAKFTSEEAARKFTEALDLTRMAYHAMGQLGI